MTAMTYGLGLPPPLGAKVLIDKGIGEVTYVHHGKNNCYAHVRCLNGEWHRQWRELEAAPVRLQLSRSPGFRIAEVSQAINGRDGKSAARPWILGNPFPVDVYGQEKAVDMHRRWLLREMSTAEMSESSRCDRTSDVSLVTVRQWVMEELARSRGMNLGCWCKPDEPCHVDLLLELANAP